MTNPAPRRRSLPKPEVAATVVAGDSTSEPTADAWTWHAREPSTWWGEDLPTIQDGQLRDVRWWTQEGWRT